MNVCIEQLVFITRVDRTATVDSRSGGGSLFAPSETCPDRQRDVRMDEEEAGTTRIREFAGWYGCMCVPGRAGAVRKVEKGQRVGETTCREHPPAASKRDGIVE